MNTKKIIEQGLNKGLTSIEVTTHKSNKLSISLFNDEIENLTSASDGGLSLRGLKDGKLGVFSSDRIDNSIIDFALDQVIENSKYGIPASDDIFLKPGLKYKKVHTYNPALESVTSDQFVKIGKEISSKLHSLDKRIDVVQTSIEVSSGEVKVLNSNNLKLSSKSNSLQVVTTIQAKQDKEVVSGFNYEILTSLEEFNIDKFVEKALKDVVSQFNGVEVKSGKYDIILNNECSAILLSIIMEQTSAYQVKNHLSLFEGKLNQKVMSSKVTVLDKPLAKSIYDVSFDDDCYPTSNKVIIKNGVLQTYLYDLQTAKDFNTVTTGNAHASGGKNIPAPFLVSLKKGKLSLDDLCKKINNGIYVTSLEGVGTGINSQSGDYSLQGAGYLIENGKLGKYIPLMTVSGNILKDFNRVGDVGSDSKITYYGVESPSISIKKVSISGK
jgi:PmbA protein